MTYTEQNMRRAMNEACLKVVDLAVIRVGAFYVVELSKLADRVCAEAERIEREGIGE